MFDALLAGVFAGYAIAVPVGVIAVLIIETGMIGGLRRGFAAGAGAATVDLLFCSLALVVGGLLNQLLAVALVPVSDIPSPPLVFFRSASSGKIDQPGAGSTHPRQPNCPP